MSIKLLLALFAIGLFIPAMAQDYANAGMDYTKAMIDNKTSETRVTAFQNYLKTYTDTKHKFVRLAHYQLAINLFDAKQYAKAVAMAQRAIELKLGEIDPGAEARITLVLANAYGIRSSDTFNQPEALKFANQAIELGKKCQDNEVVSTAEKLKEKLATPPPKTMSPLQKFQYAVNEESWQTAISEYKGLSGDEKNDPENRFLYASALLKSNQEAAGFKELEAMYAAKKEARIAKKLAEAYIDKANKKNPDSYNAGVDMYLDAGLLYQKEGNSKSAKAAMDLALFELANKYGYNDAAKKINAEAAKAQNAAGQNQAKIRKIENDIRQEDRRLRKEFSDQDIEPPQYELDKVEKLKKQLQAAKSGASTETTNEADKLNELKKQIDTEYNTRLNEAKNRVK